MELLTVGHGAQAAETFATLVTSAGVELVVDIRRFPGSRRHPQFGQTEMARWLPELDVAYRWEERLGGRRTGAEASPNLGLRNAAFRAYADYMGTTGFRSAMEDLLHVAAQSQSAVMCAEALWWRCHRRLVADAATLLYDVEVRHLMPDGRQQAHAPTPGAVVEGGTVVYPPPQTSLL
jgi:uncharacterized protein (DUF488 family)